MIYRESFDSGPGGWVGRKRALYIEDGAAVTRSPWHIDATHAPPGAGYLSILYCLFTRVNHRIPEAYLKPGGRKRFAEEHYPTDFTNARIKVRLRGELRNAHGAQMVLDIQAVSGGRADNYALTGQPLRITPEWSEQTLTLAPDPSQWTCLGARHDMRDQYGCGNLEGALGDVNLDIIFILFPLDVRPAEPLHGDPHRLWAGREYPIDPARIPEGWIAMDEIEIEFAEPRG
ncbi:MAG: hypothetical protein FJ319_01255 [SAR202 cluster bacterium]|nr:hypothetical protein [SAR202 cluster bacterium]